MMGGLIMGLDLVINNTEISNNRLSMMMLLSDGYFNFIILVPLFQLCLQIKYQTTECWSF